VLRPQAESLRRTGDAGVALRSQTVVRVCALAATAVVAATVEVAVAHVMPAGPKPQVVLVLVAALAIVGRLEPAALAAVAGGAALDVVTFRPLGASAFALLLAAAAVAGVASPLAGMKRSVAVVAVVPGAILAGVPGALNSQSELTDVAWRLLPGGLLDVALALPLVVLGLAIRRRTAKDAEPSQ
jgi:cell shape-determining protein MreD